MLVEPGEYRETLTLKNDVRVVSRVPRAATIRLSGTASEGDVAIVAGQVRGRMFAAASAGQLVAALSGRAVTPAGIQALMRDTLGDPTLVLAFAVPETSDYVDVAGDELELPEPGAERAVTPVLRDGRPVAALVYDAALDAERRRDDRVRGPGEQHRGDCDTLLVHRRVLHPTSRRGAPGGSPRGTRPPARSC